MRPNALSPFRIQTTKRHAPTVIALLVLIGAGVGACAELDSQDAANAAKLHTGTTDARDDRTAALPAASQVATDEETLLDLTSVDSPRRMRHPHPAPVDAVSSPANLPANTEAANQQTSSPTHSDEAPSPVVPPDSPAPESPSEPTPARDDVAMNLNVTSTIMPANASTEAAAAAIATEAAPPSAPAASSPRIACSAPGASTTSWLPRRPRLDGTAWSVLGVHPLFPTDAASTPIQATPSIAHAQPSRSEEPTSTTATHSPEPVNVPTTIATAPTTVHAPVPLHVEVPLKPFVPDVAAPLNLPFCITQRPVPAATRTALSTVPPPPTAAVQITTAAKTDAPASSPLIPMLLLAATAIAALATLGVSFILSRSTSAEGAARRSLNIATRLSLAFGAVAVIILGSCWYGSSVAASVGSQITFCVLAVAAASLCVVGGLWIAGSILPPLAACVDSMRALAAGNLMLAPLNLTARHEIGDLARATDRLAAAVKDIVSEVSISSTEVAAAARELSTGAQGMAAAAGQLSSQCSVAVGDASATGRYATSGGRAVQQATDEIARLDIFVRERTDEVSELAERNKHIARIVQLIDDISDRTHLVALNASIEASKAGPNGRAFSVLADEVRRLAERSLKAVEEVTASVRAVQDDTRSAAEKMSFAALQIKQGADMTDRASHDLAEIIRTSGGVSTSIQTITEAAEEAGAGAAQSASAAAQLCSRADDLKAMVSRFRIDTSAFMRHASVASAMTSPVASAPDTTAKAA